MLTRIGNQSRTNKYIVLANHVERDWVVLPFPREYIFVMRVDTLSISTIMLADGLEEAEEVAMRSFPSYKRIETEKAEGEGLEL